jgi:hypothetical protein
MMGIKARHRIVPAPNKGRAAVLSQFTGALMRAFLVMVLVATPSILLPGGTADGKQIVALVVLFLGVLTFVEYHPTYSGLIEFRDAPPYNRTRFLMLLCMLVVLSVMVGSGNTPSTLAQLFAALGLLIGQSLDFPYSPVRLVTLTLTAGSPPDRVWAVRSAAGVASLIAVVVFALMLRRDTWPTAKGAFDLHHAPTLVWVIALWAFLPACLLRRGIAMLRIASMIRSTRTVRAASPGYVPA